MKNYSERDLKNLYSVARCCDLSIPCTDFDFRDEHLFYDEKHCTFVLYVYGDFKPTPLNGYVQTTKINAISKNRAIEWANECFGGSFLSQTLEEIERLGRA